MGRQLQQENAGKTKSLQTGNKIDKSSKKVLKRKSDLELVSEQRSPRATKQARKVRATKIS